MRGTSVGSGSAKLGPVRCGREVGVVTAIFCATCGTEAAAGQHLCGSCGAALPIVCPACGTANPPDHRFCGHCGTALDSAIVPATTSLPPVARSNGQAPAPIADAVAPPATPVAPPATTAAPVAERRLVSVLFADLVGFTPFSEGRDAEDVREALTRYFGIATESITRHGGVVEKFIGDAVMAVWGTPTTHEDDAERAVRAGLELVAAVPAVAPGIEARCGILTGEAAVTIGATNQGMVAGDIVNTAARLQSAAAPSTVLVGEPTFRAASGAIAFEPAGVHALKGKAAPVPTWRALRIVAERGGRGRVEGLDAPFVGRDVELRVLKELYHVTGSERRTQHVSMIGAGGIGKSRLTWELEKYLDGIAEPVYWHRGRSPAYGQGITFRALGEIVRARAGLAESDDDATSRARIGALLDELMPESPDRVRVESALLQLLGVDGDVPPDELFGAWRTFFEQLAASGTVVLVFEDLHWADAGTLDFVDHLVDWARDHPIFVLSLARPELLERRPEWGTPRRGHASLVLEPVPEGDMRRLLDGLVPALPDDDGQQRSWLAPRACRCTRSRWSGCSCRTGSCGSATPACSSRRATSASWLISPFRRRSPRSSQRGWTRWRHRIGRSSSTPRSSVRAFLPRDSLRSPAVRSRSSSRVSGRSSGGSSSPTSSTRARPSAAITRSCRHSSGRSRTARSRRADRRTRHLAVAALARVAR